MRPPRRVPRILIVIGSLERGGSERQVIELVRSAHPQHAELVVVCLTEPGPLAGEVREVGARVEALGYAQRLDARLAAFARLLALLRREQPDVVYAWLFVAYSMALPAAALAAPGALRAAGRRSLPGADVPSFPAMRHARRLADRLTQVAVANSPAVRDAVLADSPALRGRVRVIGNGVRLPPAPARPPHGGPLRIVCVANLIPYKGHATLLDAVARLDRDGPPWQLLLVGDGPARPDVEQQVAQLGLADRVVLAGRRGDVPDLLAEADVAVLASHSEGLPNALLEAMAHGLPLVATSVGGAADLIAASGGIGVPPRDPAALAEGLRRMLADPALRERAGRRGRAVVERRYGIERMRSETLELFESMLRSPR